MISDDPEQIDIAFAKVSKSFKSGKTRDYKFRLQQLKNLRSGLEVMQK